MINKIIIWIVVIGVNLYSPNIFSNSKAPIIVNSIWGPEVVEDNLIQNLIASPIMQRLKEIDQSGPITYFKLFPKFSRYEHSIGVWILLKKINASQKEQVTGLLHDSSHTVFSHLGDHLFGKVEQEKSYQDNIHLWYLKKMNVEKFLNNQILLPDLDPDLPQYKALETSLPHICADRLQYNVHTGVLKKIITPKQAQQIINNIHFTPVNGWYFKDPIIAKQFAEISLILNKELWGASWNTAIYQLFSQILKHALKIKLISKNDIHFKTDKFILEKIQSSNDPLIKKLYMKCNNIFSEFKEVRFGKGEYNFKPKFRGIDPLIKLNKKILPLTKIDNKFKKDYHHIKDWCQEGYGIIFINN